MTDEFMENVKFSGNRDVRDDMLKLVNEVMKAHGEIEGLGDLSGGLVSLCEKNMVKVIDEDDSMAVIVTAIDNGDEIGRFAIYKQSKTIYQPGTTTSEDTAIDEDMDEDMDFLDEI